MPAGRGIGAPHDTDRALRERQGPSSRRTTTCGPPGAAVLREVWDVGRGGEAPDAETGGRVGGRPPTASPDPSTPRSSQVGATG